MIENSLHDLINVKSLDITNQLPEMEKALELIVNDMGYDAIIFVTNSLLVSGLRVLEKMNKIIPEDIAVASFNNSVLAKNSNIPLTSVDINANELGKKAMNLLVEAIEEGTIGKKLLIPYKIFIRESTKNNAKL